MKTTLIIILIIIITKIIIIIIIIITKIIIIIIIIIIITKIIIIIRLYLPRREGGRGLISVEDAINTEEININVYISQSRERMLKAAWKRKLKNVDEIQTPKEYKERMKRERTEDWSGKQLHGQFKRTGIG